MQDTISALDSLLGEQAKPQTSTTSSSTASAKPSTAKSASSSEPSFSWLSSSSSGKPGSSRGKAVTLEQVMGFEGWAPELINARAAMIGFVVALFTEFGSGESIFAQLIGGGAVELLAVVAFVTLASFAPMARATPFDEVFNANPKKVKAWGPFTPNAEIINGRAAMLALATILIVEGGSGAAFFL